MKITSIKAIPFSLPVRRDFRWASLRAGLGSFVAVKVHTDEGLVGLGEATPLPDWGGDFGRRSGETQVSVAHVVEHVISPALVGLDPTEIESAHIAMDGVLRGNSYARAAVDIALHDLWGKAAGLPLYRLLGGKVRRSVTVAHMVGIMPLDAAVDEAEAAVADGIRALQIKAGVDAQRDIRLVGVLRERLDGDVVIRVDANQGYVRAKAAIPIINEMERHGIDFIEQPVMGHAEMAKVTAAVSTPVIADESCWDPHEALDLVAANAADIISIYLAKAGGICPARKVAAIAEAAGLRCDVNGSIESGIGNAANVHFALATRPIEVPAVIPVNAPAGRASLSVGGTYYEDDVVTDAFPVEDGRLLPLERPGLGIELDEEKLERFRAN